MPRENVILISEPVTHGLRYCSCFFKDLANKARDAGMEVHESDGTVSDLDEKMESDPSIFYGVGHGGPCLFTVENMDLYLMSKSEVHSASCPSDLRLELMVGRHVHLLSCTCAWELGKKLKEAGAKSFIGYMAPFVYGISGESYPDPCDPPSDKNDFYSFCDSDVEGERVIMTGGTIKEGVEAIRAKFDEYIKRYSEGEWKDRWIAPFAIRELIADKMILRMYGEDWKPVTPPEIPWWAPALASAPIAVVGAIVGSQEMGKFK